MNAWATKRREAKAGCMWLELEREAATDVVLEVAVAA
jgi:hypothetical protein